MNDFLNMVKETMNVDGTETKSENEAVDLKAHLEKAIENEQCSIMLSEFLLTMMKKDRMKNYLIDIMGSLTEFGIKQAKEMIEFKKQAILRIEEGDVKYDHID